ncbi:MAG: dTDP-4-dehydrorhamnose 3,5-epimerase family protein [Patescibacteria group bacterium]
MKILSVKTLALPEIKVVQFALFKDHRGYFTEPYRKSDLTAHPDLPFSKSGDFVQENESFSKSHTLRGLHFQWNPFMGKMVRTLFGHMIDIVMDIRLGSPNYGKAILYDMPRSVDADMGEWIWAPPGFAHGNLFLEPTAIEYLCTGEYSQGCEAGISPLSPDIDWSLAEVGLKAELDKNIASEELLISDKDRLGLSVKDWSADARSSNFIYGKV